MQVIFGKNKTLLQDFKNSLSDARFSRYRLAANDDEILAIELYLWNARLSQSLYIYIQGWEICLRNKINDFISWRYNKDWPYDEKRFVRQLTRTDVDRLKDAIDRQERARNTKRAPTSAIVADLSAGFWVSLLSSRYEIPLVWRHNIKRIFPNDATLDAKTAWAECDRLLRLRNRIAHHEPIFHLNLPDLHDSLRRIVGGMCPATFAYCEVTCTFKSVWADRPNSS